MTKLKSIKNTRIWFIILAICSFLLTCFFPTINWSSPPRHSSIANSIHTEVWISKNPCPDYKRPNKPIAPGGRSKHDGDVWNIASHDLTGSLGISYRSFKLDDHAELQDWPENQSIANSNNESDDPCLPSKNKTKWDYIKEWHDKRATEIFGEGDGRRMPRNDRQYDKYYKGKDIEYKSDNFGKRPRTPQELDRMRRQSEKDKGYKERGEADPHWHFEHDPKTAPEMKTILDILEKAGIPWTSGPTAPF